MNLRILSRPAGLMLCCGLLAGLPVYGEGAAAAYLRVPLQVTCAPERPLLHPGESVTVRAWVSDAAGRAGNAAPQLSWHTDNGRIAGNGDTVQWAVPAAPVVAGNAIQARAVVSARLSASAAAECEVQVLIVALPRPDDARGAQPFGRAFLLPQGAEPAGYGLTSYLLLATPAQDDEERQRHLKAIEAVLRTLPPIEELRQYLSPSQLNITLLPVKRKPTLPDSLTPVNLARAAQQVLEAYDHARAQVLLAELDDTARRGGPYLVSRTDAAAGPKGMHLFFDMSHVVPRLVGDWVSAFCALAAQERSWSDETMKRLSLNTRNVIAVAAHATPDVLSNLEHWVRVLNPR